MNKKTKSLISGIVGAGLLLGAGGTFALWFDTAAVGPDGDSLATGNLTLGVTEFEGQFVWSEVSNTLFSDLVDTELAEGALLVPGDTVAWEWTDGDIDLLLAGDTIVANLYLDGVAIEDINGALDALAPLEVTFIPGSFAFSISADGSVLVFESLTAENYGVRVFEAPTFTVTFPVNEGESGFGYLPGDLDGDGYGRDRSEMAAPVDISALSIRLQQDTN